MSGGKVPAIKCWKLMTPKSIGRHHNAFRSVPTPGALPAACSMCSAPSARANQSPFPSRASMAARSPCSPCRSERAECPDRIFGECPMNRARPTRRVNVRTSHTIAPVRLLPARFAVDIWPVCTAAAPHIAAPYRAVPHLSPIAPSSRAKGHGTEKNSCARECADFYPHGTKRLVEAPEGLAR